MHFRFTVALGVLILMALSPARVWAQAAWDEDRSTSAAPRRPSFRLRSSWIGALSARRLRGSRGQPPGEGPSAGDIAAQPRAENEGEAGTPATSSVAGSGGATGAVSATALPEPAEETRAQVLEQEDTQAGTGIEPKLLMKALGRTDSPVQVYGWLQNSFTGNTNGTPRNRLNYSVFPNRRANDWQGNQYYIIIENVIKQEDYLNFGFRIDALFGNDWEFTKAFGLFDDAFEPNSFRGLDFPQIYGEAHLPILTPKGVDVKGGRWYSPAGFESVQAIYRPALSVPNVLNFTPFTFFGVLTTLHASDRLDLYAGSVNGPDRWIDQNLVWNSISGLKWTSRSGKTTLTDILTIGPAQLPFFLRANATFVPTGFTPPPFMAGKRNVGYTHRDRFYHSAVLSHKWSDKLTEAFEAAFVFDENMPNFGPNGTPETVGWYGFCHHFLYDFNEKLLGMWRSEIFRDNNGAVLGQADNYYEITLSLRYKHKSWLWIRPEARYDWAQYHRPYNDGTRQSQLTLAFDVILLW